MKNTFKILLATDYSQSVMNAEHYAVQFAKATNSDITLLHVFEPSMRRTNPPVNGEKIKKDIRREEGKKIDLHLSKLLKSFHFSPLGVKAHAIIKEGSATGIIVKEAKERGVDVIVMGTHGATGFIDRIFGSHTWGVIRNAGVPVFAVPEGALFTGLKNIVFATEYREGEIQVIKFLSQMAKMFDAELTILHITNYALLKELEIILFDTFHKEVKQSTSYSKIFFRMMRDDAVTEGLNRYCIDHKVDLLVMSPQKQALFEKIFSPDPSITKRMAYQTKISLMTVPDYYHPENIGSWKVLGIDRHPAFEDM
jgi:nucleotide-binding universal stress UspA family protein